MGMGSRWIRLGLQIVSFAGCLAVAAAAASGWWVVPFQQQDQSQPQTQQSIFRAEHNEVEMVVTVRDSKGEAVSNLKPSDFEVRDNGKLQSITSFVVQGATDLETAAPLQPNQASPTTASPAAVQRRFVALFFEDVHTEAGDFARVQNAAKQYVQENLEPEDRVAIVKTSGNGEVTFTNDKKKLVSAIDTLHARPTANGSNIRQCPRISNYEAYLIANHLDPEPLNIVTDRLLNCICPPPRSQGCPKIEDLKSMADGYAQETWQLERNASKNLLASLDDTVRVLGTMPGRRMLVLNSSGFLSGDLEYDMNRLIDNALNRGVVINALSAKGLYAETPGGKVSEQRLEGSLSVSPATSRYETEQFFVRLDAENAAMSDLVDSTGGRFFKNSNDLLQGLNELMATEVFYSLAFSPHPLKHDGKFHELKVRVKTGGLNVYARKGYFAPTGKKSATARAGLAAEEVPVPPFDTRPAPAESKASAGHAAAPPLKTEGPAQPASAKDGTAKSPTTNLDAAAATSPASDSNAKPATAAAAAELSSDRAFLNRASVEVQRYIAAFADLTADETRVMQSFDARGLPDKERSMQSALVIYRLRNDPNSVIEYREVMSIDGHEIKGHVARATKLWQGVAGARSSQEEIRRLNADSERYDLGMAESGLTLFEGLPLRSVCADDFTFRRQHREIASGRSVLVFAYQQVRPCPLIVYHFGLPPSFADTPVMHAGELTLDAETGQIAREERNVYAGSPGKRSPRVAHIIFHYGESPFGILVPKKIEIETFLPRIDMDMAYTGFLPFARMVQTYGPFSRFEVSIGEKVSAPAN